MSIQCLGQRLGWIGAHIPGSLTADFERVFRTFWNEWSESQLPQVNTSDSIFVHLIYALFRHRNWCRTEIFPAVLVEAIADEYDCDRSFIRSIVFRYIDLIDSEKMIEKRSNREFLLYVLIQATSPIDDEHVAEEIGLGREILAKLKGAANSSGRTDAADGHYVFLPEIDDIFCQILKDLARELKKGAWVLDSYRLKFHLIELPAPWKVIVEEVGTEWLLRILTVMGTRVEISCDEFAALANEKIAPLLFAEGLEYLNLLLSHLEARQLIYPVLQDAKGRKKTKKWHLTSLGQDFTANMFAEGCIRDATVSEEQVLELNEHWQVALIRKLPHTSLGTVLRVLSSTRPLNSESYFPAILKLKDEVDHGTLSLILHTRIKGGGTPGVRAAACRASGALEVSPALCDLLREISVADPSFLVKESAIFALQKQVPGKR